MHVALEYSKTLRGGTGWSKRDILPKSPCAVPREAERPATYPGRLWFFSKEISGGQEWTTMSVSILGRTHRKLEPWRPLCWRFQSFSCKQVGGVTAREEWIPGIGPFPPSGGQGVGKHWVRKPGTGGMITRRFSKVQEGNLEEYVFVTCQG